MPLSTLAAIPAVLDLIPLAHGFLAIHRGASITVSHTSRPERSALRARMAPPPNTKRRNFVRSHRTWRTGTKNGSNEPHLSAFWRRRMPVRALSPLVELHGVRRTHACSASDCYCTPVSTTGWMQADLPSSFKFVP